MAGPVRNKAFRNNRGPGYSVEMNGRQVFITIVAVVCMLAAAFGAGIIVGRRMGPTTDEPARTADGDAPAAATDTTATAAETAPTAATETTAPASAPVPGKDGSAPSIVFYDGAGNAKPAAVEPPKAAPAAPAKSEPVAAKAPSPAPTQSPVAAPAKPAVTPAPAEPAKPKAAAKAKDSYTIQISSFQDEAQANQLKSELKRKGYDDAYVQKASVQGKGTWYRVRVGHFKTKDSANILAERLRLRDGMRGYISTVDD